MQANTQPQRELSENARLLLGNLNLRGGERYACISERRGLYYVLPTPTWNWDGRFELKYVLHPECIQELVDYGFLIFGEYDVHRSESDYATSGLCTMNKVYVLTEEGKKEGSLLLAQ